MDNFNIRKNVSDAQEFKLKFQCLTTKQNVLFAEGNYINSKTVLQVSGICFKKLAGKVQDWNPKTVLKRSHFFLLKGHSEP